MRHKYSIYVREKNNDNAYLLYRKLVETLFSTPPESSFEEALQYFLKAEKAEPGFWNKNALMIAKSYEKIGK